MTNEQLKQKYYSEKSIMWYDDMVDYSNWLEDQLIEALRQPLVSGMLPINDTQIRAYGLLQLIAKAEMIEPSPYSPENDIRKRNIANWKKEYYTLIGNLR